MYAWSNFTIEHNQQGQATKTVKCGQEVTRQSLNVSEKDWEDLIEAGAVRPQPYPDIPDNVAPAEYFRSQNAARASGKLTHREVQERSDFQLPV